MFFDFMGTDFKAGTLAKTKFYLLTFLDEHLNKFSQGLFYRFLSSSDKLSEKNWFYFRWANKGRVVMSNDNQLNKTKT